MPDMITVLACLRQCVAPTTLRRALPSDDGSNDVDDRTRDDAGHCALGRPRW